MNKRILFPILSALAVGVFASFIISGNGALQNDSNRISGLTWRGTIKS